MTFFANAGIKWPNSETKLREAGGIALAGSADFWRLLSIIEARAAARGGDNEEERLKNNCVQNLRLAVDKYSQCLGDIGTELVDGLTDAELDLVGVPYFYFRFPEEFPIGPRRFNPRALYKDLIIRIDNLASRVRSLNLGNDRNELVFQVFRAMREWELILSIARLISVLNRRPG